MDASPSPCTFSRISASVVAAHGSCSDGAGLGKAAAGQQAGLAHHWLELRVPLWALGLVVDASSEASVLCEHEKGIVCRIRAVDCAAPAQGWLEVCDSAVGCGRHQVSGLASCEGALAVVVALAGAHFAASRACMHQGTS